MKALKSTESSSVDGRGSISQVETENWFMVQKFNVIFHKTNKPPPPKTLYDNGKKWKCTSISGERKNIETCANERARLQPDSVSVQLVMYSVAEDRSSLSRLCAEVRYNLESAPRSSATLSGCRRACSLCCTRAAQSNQRRSLKADESSSPLTR